MTLSKIMKTITSISPKRSLASRLKSQLNLECVKRDLKYVDRFCRLKDALILDLGCQTGYITAYIASKEYNSVGLDIRCPKWQSPIWKKFASNFGASFLLGDGENLPLKRDKFHVVVSYGTIEHVENIHVLLQEINRVLVDNGLLFIFGLPRKKSATEKIADALGLWHHERRFEEVEVHNLLEKHGFVVEEVKIVNFFPASLTIWNVAYIWLFLSYMDRILNKTPFKLLSHSLIVVSRKMREMGFMSHDYDR